jgi:hypothetical protein
LEIIQGRLGAYLDVLWPGHRDFCVGEDFIVVLWDVSPEYDLGGGLLTVSIATPWKLGYFINPLQELSGWKASWITSSRGPYCICISMCQPNSMIELASADEPNGCRMFP